MRKNAFNHVCEAQNEILKRSNAMKDIQRLLKCKKHIMYDKRKDIEVNIKDCKISTLNRFNVTLTSLLKYVQNEEHKEFLLNKRTECVNEITFKEKLEREKIIAEKRAKSREYWKKKNAELAEKMKLDNRIIKFIIDENNGRYGYFDYDEDFNPLPPSRYNGTNDDWLLEIYNRINNMVNEISVDFQNKNFKYDKIRIVCNTKTANEYLKDVKYKSTENRKIEVLEHKIAYNIGKHEDIEIITNDEALIDKLYVILLNTEDTKKQTLDTIGIINIKYAF